jgi:hypothetical protein
MQNWIKLLAGILLIIGFIGAVKGLRMNSVPLQKIAKEIDRQGLESDALFYSESPKAVEVAYLLQQQIQQKSR